MKGKSIHEIKDEHGAEMSGLLQDYYREIDEVRAMRDPEGVAYLDKLTAEGQAEILREQKAAAKDGARSRALERYREAAETHRGRVESRKAFLDKTLFNVGGTPGEAMLPHAATATEEGLMDLLDAAVIGGSPDQARAVLAVAHRRGAEAVVGAYLERANPEAGELYAEYQVAPSADELDKQEAQAETFVHDPGPDSLRYAPSVA